MIKAILWDIDGTLLNFLAAEKAAIRKCFEICGLGECTDEMLAAYSKINVRYWQSLERGEMTKAEILVGRFREFFGEYGLDVSAAERFNSEYQVRLGDTIVFEPHAQEILRKYQGRILQCAVTNGTKIAQERKLANSGMDEIFDYVFISEEIGAEKPSLDFFKPIFELLEVAGIGRDEVLIVGDSLTSDIKGGMNAGFKICWYNPGGKPLGEGYRADYIISDLAQVEKITQ